MKIKGIHPLEQHSDKLVVGVTATLAAGVVGITLLTQPNAVKPDASGPTVPPAAAFESAEREAEKLRDRLLSGKLEVPDVANLTLSTKFDDAMKGAASGAPRLALGDGRSSEVVTAAVVASADRFGELAVPAPEMKGLRTYQATVSPVEWFTNKELAKLLPPVQPFDKAFVSVEGLFNGVRLRELLEADPDGDGPLAAMPTGWWRESDATRSRDLIAIVAVEVERRMIRKPDGTSADETVQISGMPGRQGVYATWMKTDRQTEVIDLLDQADSLREQIERPEFYDIIAGPKWVPPSEVVEDGAEDNTRRIETARERLKALDAEIKTLSQQAESAPSAKQPRTNQQSGGGGRGKSGSSKGGNTQGEASEKGPTREALLAKVRNKQDERKRVVDSLIRLGESEESLRPEGAADPVVQEKAKPAMLESEEVRVWVHDVTAERGATYAYRMRVVVNNPMFGRTVNESQTAMTKSPLLMGAWTDWTAPVEVDRSEYFFVTSADVRDGLNVRPRAIGELFEFYYGYYRRAMVTLEPGDVAEGEAKLPADLKFADVKKIQDFLNEPGTPAPQTVAPQTVAPQPERGPRGPIGVAPAPAGGSDGGAEGETGPVLLTQAAPKSRVLKFDAMMLDVASTVAAGAKYVALFRDAAGRIVTRSPESDRSQSIYRRLAQSVREGADQGKVEVKAPTQAPVKQERPRDSRSGGGSGGGGG
jgi:hypothetical protein